MKHSNTHTYNVYRYTAIFKKNQLASNQSQNRACRDRLTEPFSSKSPELLTRKNNKNNILILFNGEFPD